MNKHEYRELLEELRDAIDDALELADRANWSKQVPGQGPDEAIKTAQNLLHNAVSLVEKTIKENE